MDNNTLAVTELNKAKIALMMKPDSAFFSTLCFNMRHVWDLTIPTAKCNGKTIKWNPNFFMSLANSEERIFLLLHETMHAAYLHMLPARIAGRNPAKWNIACDHVINLQLIERGFTMPTGANKGLANPKYKGMSVEQVYLLIPDSDVNTNNYMSDIETPEGDIDEVQQEMQDILIQAVTQSKLSQDKAGTVPGSIEIYLDKLLTPILPFGRILQKYFSKFSKNDYTFKRPNRRFFPQYYLPSLLSENLIDLTIALDSSCSVEDSDFLRFVSEIKGIFTKFKPEKITLIQFDTRIKSIDTVANVRELAKIKFTGRGGTRINNVIEWANTNKPQLLLVFTDGEFNFPRHLNSKTNTLWIIHNNPTFVAPWGKVIHYNI